MVARLQRAEYFRQSAHLEEGRASRRKGCFHNAPISFLSVPEGIVSTTLAKRKAARQLKDFQEFQQILKG
jgi:hypothetical protein